MNNPLFEMSKLENAAPIFDALLDAVMTIEADKRRRSDVLMAIAFLVADTMLQGEPDPKLLLPAVQHFLEAILSAANHLIAHRNETPAWAGHTGPMQ